MRGVCSTLWGRASFDVQTLIYPCVGALALLGFFWRLSIAVRTPRTPALWAVACAILFAALGFGAAIPRIYTRIGVFTGVPNLASLVVYSAIDSALLAQTTWLGFLVAGDSDNEVERQHAARSGARVLVVTVIVLAAIAALFCAAPVEDSMHATDFDDYYAQVPMADAFLAVYLVVYSATLANVIDLSRRWIPRMRQLPWLRRGLRLLSIGAMILLGYSLCKVVAIVGSWLGWHLRQLNITVGPEFASVGAAVTIVGYVTPSLGPALERFGARAAARQGLDPLWIALRDVAPDLVAEVPRRGKAYRQVIEIRDWMQRLRPYLSDDMTDLAERLADEVGVPDTDRAAAIEAARIAVALRARRAARPSGEPGIFQQPPLPGPTGEMRWLTAVASAFKGSPIVPAALREVGRT
jgi:hypothetical protein